mgnify:FL=1
MEYILKKEILAPFIIILICFFLCLISKRIVHRIFHYKNKKLNDGKVKTIINLVNNITQFVIVLIGVLVILEIYGIDTKSLVASFGIVGLVTGLALQDLLKDLIVGISIIFEGQYSIGDWVKINDFKGMVMPSNLRTTKLKAFSGEIKTISNRNITEITNYSLYRANIVINVDVAYESDIEKVKQVLDEMCNELKEKYQLDNIECLGIQELASSSIRFGIVLSCKYEDQFKLEREIKKEIVLELSKNNITIPYNQVVIHNG